MGVYTDLTAEEFVEAIQDTVQRVCREYEIYPSVCMAQACIESEFGKSTIGNYNLFGRKDNGEGPSVKDVLTQEEINGTMETVKADFEDYTSLEEAIKDYCVLITEDEQYAAVMDAVYDFDEYVETLASIYATDSTYGDLIKTVIIEWDFRLLD